MKKTVIDQIARARANLEDRIIDARPRNDSDRENVQSMIQQFDVLGEQLDDENLRRLRPSEAIKKAIDDLKAVNAELKKASDKIEDAANVVKIAEKVVAAIIKIFTLV